MKLKRLMSSACALALMVSMIGAPALTGKDLVGNAVTASAASELNATDLHVNIYAVDYSNNKTLLSSLDVYAKVKDYKNKTRYMFTSDKIIFDSTKVKDIEFEYSIPNLLSDQQVDFNGYLQYHFYNADYDAAGAGVGKDDVQHISPEQPTSVYTWKTPFASDPHDYTLMALSGQILNFNPYEYVPPTTPVNTAAVTISDVVYTGKAKTPTAKVVLDGKTLKKGVDYTIDYRNNTSVGRATATINGIGNYRGKKTASFYILPAQTKIKTLKSTKTKSVTLTWTRDNQVAGYTVQIALDKNFTSSVKKFNISKNSTVSKKVNGLKKGKTYYARVQGYKKVGSKNLQATWSKVLKVKCK